MKTKLLFLTFLIACYTCHKTYGQFTTSIDQVHVNGQTMVTDCGTIDFKTTENNTLTFYFTLTKTGIIDDGWLRIKLKNNSSSNGGSRGASYIDQEDWNNGDVYINTIVTNIDASEVQISGSSVYLEFTEVTSPYTYHNSCEYSIIKTPTPEFTLTPASLSFSCGDTSSRIFTITPSNIPSGANVTYQWSHPGWSLISSTATSKTLKPTSGNSLPSNVSVTPYIDGVAESTEISNISRAPFSTSASIEGGSVLCSSGTYTISNLPSGVFVQSASSSNTNIATVSLNSNNQITVNKVSNGIFILSVVLENSCSQTKTKTKSIQVGENANVGLTGLENGIDAGDTVNLSLTNSNGCGYITFSSASSGLSFDHVGLDYAVLRSTSSNSGTGWVYISISGGTSIYKQFPINTIPPPVIPNESYISIARVPNNYTVYPYNQWKMVKVYYYGNSSDVDRWEWYVGNSYYTKPNDTSVIFLPSSSSNVNVSVRACNSDGCSQYVSTVIN